MAYPLLLPAGSFITGLILAGLFNPHFPAPLVWLLLAGWLSAWLAYFLKKDRLAYWLLILAFLLSGGNLRALSNNFYQNNPLRDFQPGGYLNFKSLVLKSPARGHDRDGLLISTWEVETNGQLRKIKAKLQLTVPHSSTSQQPLELQAGDELEFSASLNEDSSFKNFFSDFMPRYLRSQKIQARAYTKSPFLLKKLNGQISPWPGSFPG
jgi:competence protein ComEC